MHPHELLTTFAFAGAFGVCLFSVARYFRSSAIAILLAGGVFAGPEGLGIVNPQSLGDGLGIIISLSVAIILFEGGMTLDLKDYRSASREIIGILTIGVLVTWLGITLLVKLVFGFDWAFCLLSASLVIVTGPTVIGPMLHRIRVIPKLQSILHWEGVLIDPIGVFLALMCFEYYVSTDGAHGLAFQDFILRFAIGGVLGVGFGFLLDLVLRQRWMDDGHTNIFVLAMGMLNFTLADLMKSESGLLSVTIAGLVLGIRKTPQLRAIVNYKTELKDFLIGLLFILLAANLDLQSFVDYGWKLMIVVVTVMFVIRPLNVFLSTLGGSLNLKEKLFLSWIAPRGIVAASMASVFALALKHSESPHAQFIETLTFSVIAATVIVQGFTAGLVGRLLGVLRPIPEGWIIVGAHTLGQQIARFFERHGVDVVLVDTNAREVRSARQAGHTALNEDAMMVTPEDHPALFGCGNLLALTANPDLNRMLCHRWSELLEGQHVLRWEKSGYETAENQHLLTGNRVWGDLPLNRWMHPDSEPAPMHIQRREITPPPNRSDILLTARNQGVIPGVPTSIHEEDSEWLVYDPQQSQQRSPLPLVAENVLFTKGSDLKGVYLEMLEQLKQQWPAINTQQVLAEMWKHEEDYTSLLGNGIALPHSWSDDVEHSSVAVARPQTQIICPLTNRPIEIVFMLLSPTGSTNEHLEHLSFIARLIGSQSQRDRILQARDPQELFEMIIME